MGMALLKHGRYQNNAILGYQYNLIRPTKEQIPYLIKKNKIIHGHLDLWFCDQIVEGHIRPLSQFEIKIGPKSWIFERKHNCIIFKYLMSCIMYELYLPEHIKNLSEGFDAKQKVWNGHILELCFLRIWEIHLRNNILYNSHGLLI